MKIDAPSALLGFALGAAALSAGSPPHAGIEALSSLAAANLPVVAAAVLLAACAFCGAVALVESLRWGEDMTLAQRLLRTLSAKHPAALALGIDWSATPPAATPADWIDAHDIPLDGDPREFELKATEAFATDLFRRHDRDLVEALTLSLHAAGVGSAEQRLWHFREMAARFAPGHKTSAYSAFVIDARRLHPDLARGYDGERADVALRHAYPSTAAMTFLARARRNAVVPTSDFFWLKLADRPLWYALNNVGRESFHVEGAAEVAHRIAELERGEAVLPPRVQSAVDGVAAYVAQHSCRPEAVFAAGRTDAAGATPRARAESLNQ